MLRPSLTTAAIALLGASVMAQGSLKSRLQPITSAPKHAGVFHVATGTWTRHGTLANLTAGPDTIYNNTCGIVYYGAQALNEKWQHRSRVPSTTGPTTTSQFYGTGYYDERPGCHDSYTVNGYKFAYCSNGAGTALTYVHEFANSFLFCGQVGGDMIPDVSFTVTGLPGGPSAGVLACWVVDIDLSGSTTPWVLQADGDGSYIGPSDQETFGYSQNFTAAGTGATSTGPLLAGDFTWTGGTLSGPLTPCTGTDGTIWDSPINLSEVLGTGMSSLNQFRITGSGASVNPGCYWFGGNPHGDFYLKLFSDAQCPGSGPMVNFCDPGTAGVMNCPCTTNPNPPSGPNRGCNNFQVAGGTGGGTISASGSASLSNDTLILTGSNQNPTQLTIFMQWAATTATGVQFHAGVRCGNGPFKRLYSGAATAGGISRPAGTSGNNSLPVHVRSANLGDNIPANSTRYYANWYRDANAATMCGFGTNTAANITNSGSVLWNP